MKPLHAAALALVGWYLMMPPPLSKDGRMHPLSDWTMVGAFKTEKECDAKLAKRSAGEPEVDMDGASPPEEVYSAQCAASGDPRFKLK